MKLDMPDVEIEKSSDFEKKSFGIRCEDMGIILGILRSKLYSNPIKSAVQEYISNSRDAHREAGKPELPIEVSIPTNLDPSFRVRDFGPGITPQRMADVFINYGASTKRNSNLQVGGFGIGAKSAFAVSNSFNIESITNETGAMIKRTYVALIDASGIGEINLVNEESTDEAQGTCIIIPVAEDDFHKFDEYAHTCTEYWEVRPVFTGSCYSYTNGKPDFTANVLAENLNKISMHKVQIYRKGTYNFEVKVVLDGIPYPVRLNNINYNDIDNSFLHGTWVMYFNTGELGVSANRDDIEYTQESNKKIVHLLSEVSNVMLAQLMAEIKNAPNIFEAYQKVHELRATYNYKLKGDVPYKDYVLTHDCVLKVNAQVYRFTRNNGIKRKKMAETFYPIGCKCFVYNDLENTEAIPRNRLLTLLDSYDTIVMLNKWASPEAKEADTKRYGLNNFNFINLSSVTPKRMPRGPRGANAKDTTTKVMYADRDMQRSAHRSGNRYRRMNDINAWRNIWCKEELDISALKDGYYVVYSGTTIKVNDKEMSESWSYGKLPGVMEKCGIEKVYGFEEKQLKNLDKSMKPLAELIDEKVKELLAITPVQNYTIEHGFADEYSRIDFLQMPQYFNLIKNTKGVAYKYIRLIDSQAHGSSLLSDLVPFSSIKVNTDRKTLNLVILMQMFQKKYPLLHLLSNCIDSKSVPALINYINLKDSE